MLAHDLFIGNELTPGPADYATHNIPDTMVGVIIHDLGPTCDDDDLPVYHYWHTQHRPT